MNPNYRLCIMNDDRTISLLEELNQAIANRRQVALDQEIDQLIGVLTGGEA